MNTASTNTTSRIDGSTESRAQAKPTDPCQALQGFLFLDLMARSTIWATSLALTCAIFTAINAWPESNLIGADFAAAWTWGIRFVWWVVLYNLIYVALLVLLRLPIPTPRPGVYSTVSRMDLRKSSSRQLLYSCFIALLTKARYEAPFPAFLVFHISNLPPMRWLMGSVFGPKSRSCYVTDPTILDPSFVEIGRNVVIGSGTDIAGHCQLPDLVSLKKTKIEDDAVIGANCTVFGGVHIKRGAMIGAGSVVSPYTVVGPSEYWSGVPAVKIRDLPRPGHITEYPALSSS
ncbi:MAG: hypothetical protein MI923_28520 [Phycisphaerales bacterium]|nr:hypothetical protein [Phycisphaerales bacterium]